MNNTRGIRVSFCLLGLLGLLAKTATAAQPYTENPGAAGDGSYTNGPEYKTDRDLTDLGNPKGKYFEFTMKLADSKIFKGDDKTLEPEKKQVRTQRKIFVYVPDAYKDGTYTNIFRWVRTCFFSGSRVLSSPLKILL